VWRNGSLFGCEFEESVSPSAISAALLRASPGDREDSSDAAGVSEQDLQPAMSVAQKMWLIIALSLASWALVLGILSRLLT